MVSLAATLGDGPFPRTGCWETASNDFRGVISLAANYELNTLSWGTIWTPTTGDAVEARKLASPVNHVRGNMRPILILHSDNDRSVPIANALQMVEALKKAGVAAVYTPKAYDLTAVLGELVEIVARAAETAA